MVFFDKWLQSLYILFVSLSFIQTAFSSNSNEDDYKIRSSSYFPYGIPDEGENLVSFYKRKILEYFKKTEFDDFEEKKKKPSLTRSLFSKVTNLFQSKKTPFYCLPLEIRHHIYSFLSKEDRSNLKLVNHLFGEYYYDHVRRLFEQYNLVPKGDNLAQQIINYRYLQQVRTVLESSEEYEKGSGGKVTQLIRRAMAEGSLEAMKAYHLYFIKNNFHFQTRSIRNGEVYYEDYSLRPLIPKEIFFYLNELLFHLGDDKALKLKIDGYGRGLTYGYTLNTGLFKTFLYFYSEVGKEYAIYDRIVAYGYEWFELYEGQEDLIDLLIRLSDKGSRNAGCSRLASILCSDYKKSKLQEENNEPSEFTKDFYLIEIHKYFVSRLLTECLLKKDFDSYDKAMALLDI